ncbi:acyl-CoA dehydrogenase [Tistrella mobilis]|uniref:3-methylmercaptopropionyl-CoA dehydrogenase n=1 Tax=Tistrella mobilis (strain KA081020-065) TaxID=1110502 RepID=I3TI80_TISMK|nr:acyl-CoA dehydrogenase [Tistrella mobilis]AFK52468.1 acyl-CoA dehydrogenase family protein [Tistrella mobilis KA081020-065]
MDSKIINRRDLDFMLYDMLDVESLTTRPRFADHSRDTFDAAIDLSMKIATDHYLPHLRKNDTNEPRFENGRVVMIPEVKAAVDQFIEAGLLAAGQEEEWGGMQLPTTVAHACYALFDGANVATASYTFLTIGASNLIKSFGSDVQRERYLRPMLAGRFFGTMALTEPQAGSGLADVRTRAVPQDDGTYRITGNKIFISAGDHELSENIIHMVLARIEGAPAGVKGISLFIVPKVLVNEDGSLGARNDVALGGLIHKMGWRGTTSTMLNFGENGGAVGYLVGEPHKGLSYMFQMMNEARIGVGRCAVMLGYAGYLHSLDYARNRPQGRLPTDKDPASPQVPIVNHADVKRMLLAQKAAVEGGLALTLSCARLVDEQETGETEAARAEAQLLLDILTPIAKAWPSDYCLEANVHAIQIHGGYGFTREYQVEQYYRDNRLNPIHEGTNGIQAIDLLGRKVTMMNGAALQALGKRYAQAITDARASGDDRVLWLADRFEEAVARLRKTTETLVPMGAEGKVELFLANATAYLHQFGHTVLAWIWLRQATTAARLAAASPHDAERAFLDGKFAAARYFYVWELPKTAVWAGILESKDDTLLATADASF